MRKLVVFSAIILFFFSSLQVVQAGTFYLHDHPSYWWYVVEEPAFSAIIPARADNYIQRSIYGMENLLMTFEDGTITMELNYQPGTDVESVRNSLEVRYKPLVKNITVLSNDSITTSNNLQAHFYAYQATGADGKDVMFRSVFFQRGRHVAYFVFFLEADKYKDDMREYWIRAVNGFEWN